MAHTEEQVFSYGKTIQVKALVTKARLPDELHAQDEYPYAEIEGIPTILYNANVGGDEPEWRELEVNFDLGALIAKNAKLEKDLQSLRMHHGKLKKRLESVGMATETT